MNSFLAMCLIACFAVQPFNALPLETVAKPQEEQVPQHETLPLPAALTDSNLPAVDIPNQWALLPITLLDVEPAEQSANAEASTRNARGLGLLGLGGLGKFSGLGLGFKGLGGGLGLGGLHGGLGGGLHGLGGGFKPFFGKFLR